MTKTTKEKILDFLNKNGGVRPFDLEKNFKLSRSMVHRHLLKLQKENLIIKSGSAPKVSYIVIKHKSKVNPKDEVEFIAKIARPIFKKYNLKKVQIFGSASRGEMNKNSDLDFLVEFSNKIDGYTLMTFTYELEDYLGRKVDVVTKNGLSKFIAPYIQKDLKQIYEA